MIKYCKIHNYHFIFIFQISYRNVEIQENFDRSSHFQHYSGKVTPVRSSRIIEKNSIFHFLQVDNIGLRTKRCQNPWCIIIPIIEVILIGVFFYFSTRSGDFQTKINLNEGLQILTSRSDMLSRQCGFDKSFKRYDLYSPNIQKLLDHDQDEQIFKQQLIQLCTEFQLTYEVEFDCNQLYINDQLDQQKYNEFTTKLYDKLPQVQDMAVYTDNGIICTQDQTQSCDLIQKGEYLCLQEFFDIAKYHNIQLQPDNQVITSAEYLLAGLQLEQLNISFLTVMCQNIQTNVYEYQKLQQYSVCTIDQTQSITKIITNYIKIPDYIDYLIQYFMYLSSNFISELQQHWKSICFTAVPAVIYSYFVLLVITTLTQTIIILSSFLPPILFVIVIYLLIQVLVNKYNDNNFNWQTFGYNKISQYFTFAILVIIVLILGLCTIGLIALSFISIKSRGIQSQLIKVCQPILLRRIKMLFIPILFTILDILICLGVLYTIFLMVYNGNYNSDLNVVSFQYMTDDYQIKTDPFKIILIVVVVIVGLHLLFFLMQSSQYLITNLAYIYYLERSSPQYFVDRKRKLDYLRIHKKQYYAKLVDKGQKLEKQSQIEQFIKNYMGIRQGLKQKISKQEYRNIKAHVEKVNKFSQTTNQVFFDTGLKDAYLLANKNYIKQIGTIFLMSFLSVILCIPKIFLSLINWIQKQARLQRFADDDLILSEEKDQCCCKNCNKKKQSNSDENSKCCKKKEGNVLDRILASTDKLTLYYYSLTQCDFITAVKHSKYLYEQNAQLLKQQQTTSKILTLSCKFAIVIAINVTWALWFKDLSFLQNEYQYSTQEYPLTAFIILTIMGFIISSMVLQIIELTNMSIFYIFNFENMLIREGKLRPDDKFRKVLDTFYSSVTDQFANDKYKINTNLLPKALRIIIERRHLQEPNMIFNYKDTFKTATFQ